MPRADLVRAARGLLTEPRQGGARQALRQAKGWRDYLDARGYLSSSFASATSQQQSAALAVLSVALMVILSKTETEATEKIKAYLTQNPRYGERDYNAAKHRSSKTPFVWMERLFVLMFVASVIGPMVVYSDLRLFDWLLAALQWFKFKQWQWQCMA